MKVLLFGPIPPPVTGHSIAFYEVYLRLNEKVLINTTKFGEKKIINSAYSMIKLIQYFFINNFDTVYFTSSRSTQGFIKDFVLIQLSWIFNKKVINHIHGSDFSEFYRNSLFKPLIRYSYNKINTTIVLFNEMMADFSEFNGMNIITVPNSYPAEFDSYNWDFSRKKLNILYLSNLMISKGIIDFLDASELLLEINSDLEFYIAGDFCSDDLLTKNEIKQLFYSKMDKINSKYPNRINYKGILRGNKKIQLFEQCSIFVLPTFYKTEALPISIIEAMRSGNAIISTYHKYIPKIISKDHGVLVPIRSPKMISDAILSLLENSTTLDSMIKNNISTEIGRAHV